MNDIMNELKGTGFKNILSFYETNYPSKRRSDLYCKRIRKHEYMFIVKINASEKKVPMTQLITVKNKNVELVARGHFLDGFDSNGSKIHIEFDTEVESNDFLMMIVTVVSNNWK